MSNGKRTIMESWHRYGDGDDRKLAYIMATAHWETGGTFLPVMETFWKTPGGGDYRRAAKRLERAWKMGRLKWVRTPYWREDGGKWIGRGYVQLTHKTNYCGYIRHAVEKEFGVDICDDPDLVMRPDISAYILIRGMLEGWFTGYRLSSFVNEERADFVNARKVVNPGDKRSYKPIARLAHKYLRKLRLANPPNVADASAMMDGLFWPQLQDIQRKLKTLGYDVGKIDGIWGPRTEKAVLQFRKNAGLGYGGLDNDVLNALNVMLSKYVAKSGRREGQQSERRTDMSVLDGYKTYIAVVLLVAVGIVEGVFGIDIPGVDVSEDWFTILLAALGLGGARHAIGKLERKVEGLVS